MALTLVREALRRVSVLLMDEDPQFTRYTETELVDGLNDGQAAIHKYLPASCARVDAIRLKPGTLQNIEAIAAAFCIPGDGSTPPATITGTLFLDVVCNMGAAGTTPGRAVRPITGGRETIDALNPDWRLEPGETVIKGFVFDPRTPKHFEVVPPVHASTQVWARVSYVAQPVLVPNTGTPGSPVYHASGASTVPISVADEHLDDLVYYVAGRALMKNAKFTGVNGLTASDFVSMFTASINAKSTLIMNYNPNLKKLPFAAAPIGAAS